MSRSFTRAEIAALATIAVGLAMLLVTTLAALADERLLRGVTIWSKPIKFAASFSLHLATLVVFVRLLLPEVRAGWGAALVLLGASVATLIEVLYVALQAARGRDSHFNTDTAWEAFMYYQVMGGAALALVAVTVLTGVLVLRQARPDVSSGLRLGAGWGAILGGVATLVVAGALASGVLTGPGPWIGEPRSDAGGLPLIGWSRQTGDLRVPHFFATHLIQGMAIAGWLADRLSFRPRFVVALAAVLGLDVTVATFVQAVRGLPLIASLTP